MYRSPLSPSTSTGRSSPRSTSSAWSARRPGVWSGTPSSTPSAELGEVPNHSSALPVAPSRPWARYRESSRCRNWSRTAGRCASTSVGSSRSARSYTRRFPSRRAIPRIPASASASSTARTWLVGRQYQSIAARGSMSVDDSGPLARMRASSSSTSGACSSNAPPWCRTRARSQVTRCHGSSVVGSRLRPLLYASNNARRSYSSASVIARRYPPTRASRTRSWFRPATSRGSNWMLPRRSNTASTPASPEGRERGGASSCRRTRNRRATAAGTRCGVTGSGVVSGGRRAGARAGPARRWRRGPAG